MQMAELCRKMDQPKSHLGNAPSKGGHLSNIWKKRTTSVKKRIFAIMVYWGFELNKGF